MLNKNNYIKHQYFSDYDLISKYNLKNVYKKSNIQNIIIDFSFQNFLKACDVKNVSEKDSEIQIKAYSLLYTFTLNTPFINSNKLVVGKKTEKDSELNFSLKSIISNKEAIYNFLLLLFVENSTTLTKEGIRFKNFISKKKIKSSQIVNFKINLPIYNIYELSEILSKSYPDINLKEFFITIHFKIRSQDTVVSTETFIKNLPLFWING